MDELLKINYETEEPMVSARELYLGLEIKSNFTTWFDRMREYGFDESNYRKCFPNLESGCNGGQNMTDYLISVDMAKQICMLQRSEKGKQYRQYFLDLEKAWNTPEQVFARALKMADKEIEKLKSNNSALLEDVQRMKPKEIFADAVTASHTSILIGELAKILKQNGIEIGQGRLFSWLREKGYLIKSGSSKNMPTQKSMELGLFEIKEGSYINGSGVNVTTKTPKVTGKGQQYFINKFLDNAGLVEERSSDEN